MGILSCTLLGILILTFVKAKELGFVRDTLEKFIRLVDVLDFLNSHPILKKTLALKRGTAINLSMVSFPRLSVDIDLDYIIPNSREAMFIDRDIIKTIIEKHMIQEGYLLNPKSKFPHSLDALVFDYIGFSGNKDHIKIEINYSLRAHILPLVEKTIANDVLFKPFKVLMVNPIEIYGSKITALLTRAAPRDLFDVYNLAKLEIFNGHELILLKKCVIFYSSISSFDADFLFEMKSLSKITQNRIKRELLPVLRTRDFIEINILKEKVTQFLQDLLELTPNEKEFISQFNLGYYKPSLLFDDLDIVKNIQNHPMALWMIKSKVSVG